MTLPVVLRIFLASPGDTLGARQQVANAVDDINADPLWSRYVWVELLRWDKPDDPIPCSFLRNPQHSVIDFVGDPCDCNLVVGLLRHRYGSPLPEGDFGRTPEGDLWTGTSWELHRALIAASKHFIQDVLIFRDVSPFSLPADATPALARDAFEQFEAVSRFFNRCRDPENASILRGINEYEGAEAFRAKFDRILRKWLERYTLKAVDARASRKREISIAADEELTSDQVQLQNILLSHDRALDDKLVGRVWEKGRVRGLPGYLLQRYSAWNRSAVGQIDVRFVNLDLLVDRGPTFDGLRYDVHQRYESLDGLLRANPDAGAWVLVSEPGGGKSTLLQHYEINSARSALRALASGGDPDEICVWVRLSDYPHNAADPQGWLEERWSKLYPRMPTLSELCPRSRVRFLLDGLNEIQAPNASEYREAVRRWARWTADLVGVPRDDGFPYLPPIFTVRTLEYSEPLSTPDLAVTQSRLARWSSDQMRQFCTNRLGPDNALWARIRADSRLRDLCSLPFNLSAQCDLAEGLQRPADNRAELFTGLAWLRLKRAHTRRELEAAGLLDEGDRRKLTDDLWWRNNLSSLPEGGKLLQFLERQAESMHRASEGAETSVEQSDVVPWVVSDLERRAWISASEALNFAEVELSGRFRFTHQLWQEYFAALFLRNLSLDDLSSRLDFSPPSLAPLEEVFQTLAAKDPLPGPGVNSWEEVVKLATQLSNTPENWLEVLARLNLPLAARAASSRLNYLGESKNGVRLLSKLRDELVARSTNPEVDIRLRVEASECLGWIGDPRLVMQTGSSGATYLVPTESCWVAMSALDNSPKSNRKKGQRHRELEMSFAPVTNGEYRHFVDAGGYEHDKWWRSDIAKRWRREGLRDERQLAWWSGRLRALREDFDQALRRYFPHATDSQRDNELRSYAAMSEVEAAIHLEERFGASLHRKPAYWDDQAFNNPNQPVVGVSLFEAEAYCAWLSDETGVSIRLPTSEEWRYQCQHSSSTRSIRDFETEVAQSHETSKSATKLVKQSDDLERKEKYALDSIEVTSLSAGRIAKEGFQYSSRASDWPWGDLPPHPGQINTVLERMHRPSPIGVFPLGNSPAGLTDVSGNVWEWTQNDDDARSAACGGSWYRKPDTCRCDGLVLLEGLRRSYDLGFRLVRAKRELS